MFELTHFNGVHQGGTKEYSLYVIFSRKTSKSLLIKRWGKTGADGQMKIEVQNNDGSAALDKELNERRKKGYDMRKKATTSFPSVRAVLEELPRTHRRSFFNNQLAHLDPETYDLTDRKSFDPMQTERDQMREKMEAEAKKQAEVEAKAAAAAEQDELKSHPNFGMF